MAITKNSLFYLLILTAYLIAFSAQNLGAQSNQPVLVDVKTALLIPILSFPLLIGFLISDILGQKLWQWIILILTIGLFVIVPTIISISERHTHLPFEYIHDNPIQIEEALQVFLSGQNPYGHDYSKSPLSQWAYGYGIYDFKGTTPPKEVLQNPALFHLVSLPFGFLSMIPFLVICQTIFGFFDARMFYLLCYIALLIAGCKLVAQSDRLNFLTLFSLNPLLAPFVTEGRNDVLTILLMTLVLLALSKEKYLLSAITLGLAIATKQSGWVLGLTLIIYLFFNLGSKKLSSLVNLAAVSLITAALLVGPFFLWNTLAFIDDTTSYVWGGIATAYPIKGWGISMAMVIFNWIPNTISAYPATLYQIILGLPILGFSIYLLKKQPTLKTMVICFSLLLLIFLYTARFFVDNYFGVVIQFLILAYFMKDPDHQTHQSASLKT